MSHPRHLLAVVAFSSTYTALCFHSELKAINVWYQNKRRSMKKKSLAWSKASSENHLVDPLAPSKSQFGRAFSLDLIVSSRELRDNTTVYNDAAWSLTRPPLTPRRNRIASRRARSPTGERPVTPGPSSRSDQTEIPLWEHIPSSPLMVPSSPSEDAARFAYLPPNSKMLRSLEYACAKDRLKRRRNLSLLEDTRDGMYMEDGDVPGLVLDDRSEMTVDDTDELITPDTSLTIDPTVIQGDVSPTPFTGRSTRAARKQAPSRRRNDKNNVQELPAEDVEAAMALLGFSIHKL